MKVIQSTFKSHARHGWKAASFLAMMLLAVVSAFSQTADEIKTNEKVTFSNQVSRIFQKSCQECHRPGQMAPMSLLTYEESRPWAKAIKKKVMSREMPPWHADPKYGEFINNRSLSQEEIDMIVRWVDSGTLRGNPKDLPEPIEFTDGWSIGEPDLILPMTRPHNVRASGRDTFENFHINTRLLEDRFVSAVEIMPGDRRVVHHVLCYVHQNDNFNFRDEESWSRSIGQGGTMLIEYAVGNKGDIFPEGSGRLLKKGSRLLLQIHYHPYGEATQDVTKVGLKFHPRGTEHRRIISRWIGTHDISIPPNRKDISSRSSHTFRRPVNIVSFQPHMHCRGQAMKAEVFYPDGQHEILCDVPNFDFNWQTTYTFKQPPYLPAGTRMVVTGMHDNTASNPNNPNPNSYVRWGQSTFDEMMHGWTDFVYADEEGVWPTSGASNQPSSRSSAPAQAVVARRSGSDSGVVVEARRTQPTTVKPVLLHTPVQNQTQEAPVRTQSDGLPFIVKFLGGISIAGLGLYVVFLRD